MYVVCGAWFAVGLYVRVSRNCAYSFVLFQLNGSENCTSIMTATLKMWNITFLSFGMYDFFFFFGVSMSFVLRRVQACFC